jgi:hypothetical protein
MKKCTKESYTYATKELLHTKLTTIGSSRGGKKGSTPPAKEQDKSDVPPCHHWDMRPENHP